MCVRHVNPEPVKMTMELPLNVPNRNGRIYTSKAIKKSLTDEYVQEALKQKTLMGSIGAPKSDCLGTDPVNPAFVVDALDVVEKDDESADLVANITLLNNTAGRLIQDSIADGVAFSIAPRGVGKVKNGVVKSFRLLSVDLVPDIGFQKGGSKLNDICNN